MAKNNPFSINFGKVPTQYISRDLLISEITDELTDEVAEENCFMLTGARGSGKTVTMTTIEKEMRQKEDWIVVQLNPSRDMLSSLVGKLYDSHEFIKLFVNKNLNLSKFGIGLNIETKSPVSDIESALEKILKEVQKKKKRVLVTVDEVSNTEYMREFASSFQILIRNEHPIFLIMAGLYENIRNLENEENLTFLYRTPKYDMEPLNLTLVAAKYRKIFGYDQETSMQMAKITKGYPFAYQVLGKYLWEDEDHDLSEEVLARFDEAMRAYTYDKIWSELSDTDKWYMTYIVKKDRMPVSELLESTGKKKNEFSQYRARLADKGLIDISIRGMVSCKLPRFDVFVDEVKDI